MSDEIRSSTFFATYDAQQLVQSNRYEGIEFNLGAGGTGFSVEAEFPEGESKLLENTKSISYDCSINTTASDPFDVAVFLDWLGRKTLEQLENQSGEIRTRRVKVGKRFCIEYCQDGFVGRIEIYTDLMGPNFLSVDVEHEERPA